MGGPAVGALGAALLFGSLSNRGTFGCLGVSGPLYLILWLLQLCSGGFSGGPGSVGIGSKRQGSEVSDSAWQACRGVGR